MLLLKSNRVIFKKKALEELIIVSDMFLKGKTEEMHGYLFWCFVIHVKSV